MEVQREKSKSIDHRLPVRVAIVGLSRQETLYQP